MTVSIKRTILHWRIERQAGYLALRRHNAQVKPWPRRSDSGGVDVGLNLLLDEAATRRKWRQPIEFKM